MEMEELETGKMEETGEKYEKSNKYSSSGNIGNVQ